MKHVDGLTNPKVYRKPVPKRRVWRWPRWRMVAAVVLIGTLLSYGLGPQVKSLARQVEIFDLVTNGRYLVLFQNDAEIRASGGFIGSFAIIEAKNGTIKPLYFETNIYKLDDPFNLATKIEPPKALKSAIADRGWGMRDANFAADFRESAPTILWFFNEEVRRLTGPKKAEIDRALGGNYQVDGVVATTLSAFLDILEHTGPITIPANNVTVNKSNFFPIVQQVVERDYFKDPANVAENEPKTILQNLFPLAMTKAQDLPKTTQYRLARQLLREKKILIYSKDSQRQQALIDQGWAGALELPADQRPAGNADFLTVVRSSHGGNKSSLDINPVYRYTVKTSSDEMAQVNLEIRFEHTGTADWPGGVNHEYLRVLAPAGATLRSATRGGELATDQVDIGKEMNHAAFGFWLHTQPKTSQTMTLQYDVPVDAIMAEGRLTGKKYQLVLMRQPGGSAPDITIVHNDSVLFQGRVLEDRLIQ